MTSIELLNELITIDTSECIIWPRSKNGKGYGNYAIKVDGIKKTKSCHRYALESKLGRSIKDGYFACHTCDNPSCINPKHLFEGTHTDNMIDCANKGRAHFEHLSKWMGINTANRVLTDEQVKEIKILLKTTKRTNGNIGEQFNVSHSVVSNIKRGRNYAQILV